jgi:ABC-type sugar transport system substrate-binding protein
VVTSVRFRRLAPIATAVAATVAMGASVASPARQADKVTICHRTASSKSPYVQIRVAGTTASGASQATKAVRAHLQHEGDFVVVGTATCPPTSVTASPTRTNQKPAKIAICHKTGSTTSPYVKITVPGSVASGSSPATKAVNAHLKHQGDMVLADAKASCQTTAAALGQDRMGKGRTR